MPRAKEIFPLDILGTFALGWSALLCVEVLFNRLTPNDLYMGRTAPLTSKR